MSYPPESLQGIVIAEAEKLGLAAPADVIKYIIALAVDDVEDEIEKLWAVGKRPEGLYEERFTKAVVVALMEHEQILVQMGKGKHWG